MKLIVSMLSLLLVIYQVMSLPTNNYGQEDTATQQVACPNGDGRCIWQHLLQLGLVKETTYRPVIRSTTEKVIPPPNEGRSFQNKPIPRANRNSKFRTDCWSNARHEYRPDCIWSSSPSKWVVKTTLSKTTMLSSMDTAPLFVIYFKCPNTFFQSIINLPVSMITIAYFMFVLDQSSSVRGNLKEIMTERPFVFLGKAKLNHLTNYSEL